jgi:hypothetical protein
MGNFRFNRLGWEVTKEDFMKKGSLLKYLKLKASYGVLVTKAVLVISRVTTRSQSTT